MPPKKRKEENSNGKTANKKRKTKPQRDDLSGSDYNEQELSNESDNQDNVNDEANGSSEKIVLPLGELKGEVLICGCTNWDLVGRKTLPKSVTVTSGRNLYDPYRISTLKNVTVRLIASGCMASHSVVVAIDHGVYSWGRNENGQLGLGDQKRRDTPSIMSFFTDLKVAQVACGRAHTFFLIDSGIVYGTGCNASGQLGIGSLQPANVLKPQKISHKGPPIRVIACGSDFSAFADIRGNIYTFGSPENGQLGHNTDGRYFITSSKVALDFKTRPQRVMIFIDKTRDGQINGVYDVEITDIACGQNHVVALDKKERVFTWGFGGYGRLGHADTKDEMIPRQLKVFEGINRGVVSIAAGSTYSMAINKLGVLYLWGQNKMTGDSAMYPKPVSDLAGWKIRSIGCCHKSIVVATENSVVSWGSSPTFGELCLGINGQKSTSKPVESKPLDDFYIEKVACGWSHSLFLARNTTEDDLKHLESLPIYDP